MKATIVFFLTVSAFAVSRLKQEAPEIVDGPIKVKTNYEVGDIDSELYIETLKWWHQEITA